MPSLIDRAAPLLIPQIILNPRYRHRKAAQSTSRYYALDHHAPCPKTPKSLDPEKIPQI